MNRIDIIAKLGALDLQVEASFPHQFIVISGENGAGKSTLLRCLAGLEQAEGLVIVDGNTWLDSSAGFVLATKQRLVGCAWAEAALLPWLSVEQNILLGVASVDAPWFKALAGQLEITTLLQRKPQMLSTGEAQRVALARAIYRKPAALLLDEPFSAQAPAIRERLREVLKSIQHTLQVPVLMVSHDVEDAKALAHQHWHMRAGKLFTSLPSASRADNNSEQSTKVANDD